MWVAPCSYFLVCQFVLHLARDCIDYIRCFYSFRLDVFAARPRLRSACWSLLRRLNTPIMIRLDVPFLILRPREREEAIAFECVTGGVTEM